MRSPWQSDFYRILLEAEIYTDQKPKCATYVEGKSEYRKMSDLWPAIFPGGRTHPACRQAEQAARAEAENDKARATAKAAGYAGWVASLFENQSSALDSVVLATKREGFTESEFRNVDIAVFWENVISLSAGSCEPGKIDRLVSVSEFLNLTISEQDKSTKEFIVLLFLLSLWDLSKGEIPKRCTDASYFPMLIMAPGENLLWGCHNSFYAEDKKVRNPGYGGMSVRVLSGVWARVGASNTSYSEGLVVVDEGASVLTNKAFYFFGKHQSVEIMLRNILSVEPITNGDGDGVVICKRNQSARNQFFTTNGTGWFVYRAIRSLASMSQTTHA